MRTSKTIPPYRDGYVSFVRIKDTNVSPFGAPKNTKVREDTENVVVMKYDRMTHRQRDQEFAYNVDKSLDLKIRCPYHPAVSTRLQAIIEDVLYDIFDIDADPNNMQMFVYLQQNRILWQTVIVDYHPEVSTEIISGDLEDLEADAEAFGAAFKYVPGSYAFTIQGDRWIYAPGNNIVGYGKIGEMTLEEPIEIDPAECGLSSEATSGIFVITLTTDPEEGKVPGRHDI